MAKNRLPAVAKGSGASAKGRGGWLASLAVMTLLAIGTGGAFGIYVVSTVEKAVDEKNRSEQEKSSQALVYSDNMVLKNLEPVVTNLANSGETWVRVESSIVFANGALPNPDVAAAEIRQDILAYLRTLSLPQIEGASGLQHLREDLNERASLRSKGLVRELIVETLIVQ